MKDELYILLLQKQLSGEITSEEQQRLNSWLAQSADNQKVAKTIESTWEMSGGFSEEVDLDLDTDFSKIEARLDLGQNQEAIVRKISPQRKWLRIAAALLVLAITPIVFKIFLASPGELQVVSTTDQANKEPVLLPDGTKVWLNAHSEISFLPANDGNTREVKLKGEAFFDVVKNPDRPFMVMTSAGQVTVLGTSFSVKYVEGENDFTVHVATGKVEMAPKGTSEKLILIQNESGYYGRKEDKLYKESDASLNEMAWHTGRLHFDDVPLSAALSEIGRFFDVNIEIEKPEMADCPINGNFFIKEFSSVKATFETLLGAEIVDTAKGKYLLKGGRCE